jgi:predicted TIM-barrel fold metal-dependent hydrolase
MRYCYDFMGPDRLLFASDRPWVNPKEILDGLRSLGLPLADEKKILETNARSLFRV